MTARASALLALFATAILTPTAAAAATHVVVGQNDVAIDRPAIQAAVDGADPGDRIELRGTFQLDGTPVFVETTRLTIAGQAIDDDGDSEVNEDPVDGVDNDGDGAVDEDDWNTHLVGVDDGAGGPARDLFPDRFNDGFELLGLAADLRDIELRHLKLSKLNRVIYLFPDYDDSGTVLLCDASAPTAGSLTRVRVRGNSFENSVRGVEILGRVHRSTVVDNRFVGMLSQAVVMFGVEIGCAEADGSIEQFLPLGTPDRTAIVANRVIDSNQMLLSFISERTSLLLNEVSGSNFGAISLEDSRMFAFGNEVVGAVAGLFGSFLEQSDGPATGNLFLGNRLTDNLWGVLVDCDTTGYTIVENDFSGSQISDVLLDGTAPGGFCVDFGLGDSFDNVVIANLFSTFVEDFGVDNRLIGRKIVTAPTGEASALAIDAVRGLDLSRRP